MEAGKRVAVSPAEAALMIGISRAKLYELLGSGQLRSIKVGSRRLIPMSAIESMFTEAA
jgi:excisionase family DNA binding protein